MTLALLNSPSIIPYGKISPFSCPPTLSQTPSGMIKAPSVTRKVAYSAPELLEGLALHGHTSTSLKRTPATDVYAFAMVLYELFVGREPFAGLSEGYVIGGVVAGLRPTILTTETIRSAKPLSLPQCSVNWTIAEDEAPASSFSLGSIAPASSAAARVPSSVPPPFFAPPMSPATVPASSFSFLSALPAAPPLPSDSLNRALSPADGSYLSTDICYTGPSCSSPGSHRVVSSVVHVPTRVVNLIKACWSDSPQDRPSMTEVLGGIEVVIKAIFEVAPY